VCPFSVRFWILGGVNAVVDMVGGFVGGERGGRGAHETGRRERVGAPISTLTKSSNTTRSSIMADEEQILKPGQKFPTPTPGNGDRVFYETLFRQRPESEMAQDW
jgi:hypothetical protein